MDPKRIETEKYIINQLEARRNHYLAIKYNEELPQHERQIASAAVAELNTILYLKVQELNRLLRE